MPNGFESPTYISTRPEEKPGFEGAIIATPRYEPYVPIEGRNIFGIVPNVFRGMEAGAPKGERTLSPQELALGLITMGQAKASLPPRLYNSLRPYLQRAERLGKLQTLEGIGVAPLKEYRAGVKSSTATGSYNPEARTITIGRRGKVQGLSKEMQEETGRHELLHHVDLRNISKENIEKSIDRAEKLGMIVPEKTFVKTFWNPKAYFEDPFAKRAEERFAMFLEKLSPGELDSVLGTKAIKEAFKPSIEKPVSGVKMREGAEAPAKAKPSDKKLLELERSGYKDALKKEFKSGEEFDDFLDRTKDMSGAEKEKLLLGIAKKSGTTTTKPPTMQEEYYSSKPLTKDLERKLEMLKLRLQRATSAEDKEHLQKEIQKLEKEKSPSGIASKAKAKGAEFKTGDFVTWEQGGEIRRGKVNDIDSTTGEVWLFPEDRSLLPDPRKRLVMPIHQDQLRKIR